MAFLFRQPRPGHPVIGAALRFRQAFGLGQQALQGRPVVEVLRQLQGAGQAPRIAAALPTADKHLQGLLRIAVPVQGDQLVLVAAVQADVQGQHALVGGAGIVVLLQGPGQRRAQAPELRLADRAGIHAGEDLPGLARIEQVPVGFRPLHAFLDTQREMPGHPRPDPGLFLQLLGVFEDLLQALPGQALFRITLHVAAQPCLALFRRAAGFMAVDQRIEFLVGHLSLRTDGRQQLDGAVEIEHLQRQAPGMLAQGRVIGAGQQLLPQAQGLRAVAGPFAKAREIGQQRPVLRAQGQQLPADLPGPLDPPGGHVQAQVGSQRLMVLGAQFAPAPDEAFGQVVALAAFGGAYALGEPGQGRLILRQGVQPLVQ